MTFFLFTNSERRDFALKIPIILSESRYETSGFVVTIASSAKYKAIKAPVSIPAGLSQTTKNSKFIKVQLTKYLLNTFLS